MKKNQVLTPLSWNGSKCAAWCVSDGCSVTSVPRRMEKCLVLGRCLELFPSECHKQWLLVCNASKETEQVRQLYQVPGIAVTEYHKPCGLCRRNVWSYISGGWRLEPQRVWAGRLLLWAVRENPPADLQYPWGVFRLTESRLLLLSPSLHICIFAEMPPFHRDSVLSDQGLP